jgi:hypothetical protein
MNHSSRAHHARLDGAVQCGAGQSVIVQGPGCVSYGHDFGVRRRVHSGNRLIESGAYDDPIENDDGSDGHFTCGFRFPGLNDCHIHVARVCV